MLSWVPISLPFRHVYMVLSEIVTLFIYAVSMTFLPEYFGKFH